MLCGAASARGALIASCGFEPTGDCWPFSAAGRGAVNDDPGSADSPPDQRILAGSRSWIASGGASVLVFEPLLLAGWTNASIAYRVSSTAATSDQGHSGGDLVAAYVAFDGEPFRSTAEITLKGNSRARWAYNSGAPEKTAVAGGPGLIVQPAGGGLRTADGYSKFRIDLPERRSSVALKIHLVNDSVQKHWNLDEITLSGTPTTSRDCWWRGGGTWNGATVAWASESDGPASAAWNAFNGDNAHFAQTGGGTVVIAPGATVAARSLAFEADGYVLSPGDALSKLALIDGGSGGAGANAIHVAHAGHTALVLAPLVGNPGVGLTKTGPGTLALAGRGAGLSGRVNVAEGVLRLEAADALLGCHSIAVAAGAVLDISAVANFQLGMDREQTLFGTGAVLGNLQIGPFGIHRIGGSPNVQTLQGRYELEGLLQIEINGPLPGDGLTGYDQLLVTGKTPADVILGGMLDLSWYDVSWAAAGSKLWIVRNDTQGNLVGTFANYADGATVECLGGFSWQIHYRADYDRGALEGGNDVLLLAVAQVPEPPTPALALPAMFMAMLANRARRK